MALSTYAATTLEALKEYLNMPQPQTSKDSLLETLIESCTQTVENYLGRIIIIREVNEEPHYAEDNPSRYLNLNHYPVTEIVKIIQDGAEIPLASVKMDTRNGILKKDVRWRGAVLITYKAGLAQTTEQTPKNIQLAIWQWIADILHIQENGGVKSETLGDYSASYYDRQSVPESIKVLLEAYRKISL